MAPSRLPAMSSLISIPRRFFSFTPNTGYHVDSVFVDGGSIAVASADTFKNVSANHTISVVFARNTTVTSVVSSLNPSGYSTDVTFTATVTSSGNAVTQGTVTFKQGATVLSGPTTVDGSGKASFHTAALSVGVDSIQACYSDTANARFYAASKGVVAQTVNPASTTTSMSAPALTYNANGSVTVKVVSGAGIVTGNVTLSVDGGAANPQALTADSTIFTLVGLNAGTHTLAANYATQGNFGASSASDSIVVHQAATTSFITSAPAVTFNANGVVTVKVTSIAGMVTGNVSLKVDANSPVSQPLAGDTSVFTLLGLSAGTHSLMVTYAAQGNFTASDTTGSLLVNSAGTTVSITAPPISYGATSNPIISVTSGSGTVTGSVTLAVDGGAPASQSLSSGSTTFSIPGLSTGKHVLVANYAAQGNFLAGSFTDTLVVNQASATLALSNLTQVYTGSALPITVTTNPNGLSGVSVTYNGSATVPSAVGSYTVIASLTNVNYTATNDTGTYKIQATIVATAGANGTISSVGTDTLNPGANQTYHITPATGYHVATLTVDSVQVTPDTVYTFSSLSRSHTISVTFTINTYIVTASAGANGTISPNGNDTVAYGSNPV